MIVHRYANVLIELSISYDFVEYVLLFMFVLVDLSLLLLCKSLINEYFIYFLSS